MEPPKDFAALKSSIAERAIDLPRRLTQVAEYALNFPDEVAFGTVASIAKSAGVQPSTLVRFSQSLGYNGFSDLQEIFRLRLRATVPNYGERLKSLKEHSVPSSGPGFIFHGFSQAAEKSIHELHEKLDPKQLQQAVDTLAKADTIYLLGLHRAFPVSSYMSYAFSKLTVKNVLVEGQGRLGNDTVSFATKHDCVLAISFTPYASETAAIAKAAAARNLPIVSITDSVFSPLAPISKVWLEVQESNFEGFRSLSATMALAMTITVAVAEKRSKK